MLSVAGPAVAAASAGTVTDRGHALGGTDAGLGAGAAELRSVAQSDGNGSDAPSSGTADANFTVERTAHDEFTVWLNDSYANKSLGDDTVVLDIRDAGGNLTTNHTWDVGSAPAWNGTINKTVDTPGSGDSVRGSLADATVELNGTTVNDTVPLHSVTLSDTPPVWTNGSRRYVVVERTTGVGADDGVGARLDGDPVAAEFRRGGNLLVLRPGGASPTGEPTLTVTDGEGTAISADKTVEPDVRLATDEVQLWHPAVEPGTEYNVTVHRIDGRSVNTSWTTEATATGTVPVPNATDVAGAGTVNVSLDGDATLLNQYNITVDDKPTTVEATVVGTETVRFNHSLAPLSIDAATVSGANNSAYLAADDFTVDGRQLTLSGTSVGENDSLQLQTNAGVLTVTLAAESGGDGGGSGSGGDEPGQSGLLGTVISILFPAGLLVPLVGGAVGAGLYVGREYGEPDYINVGLGVVAVTCVIVLAYFVGEIFSISTLTNLLLVGGAIGAVVLGAGSYAVGGIALHDSTTSRGRHRGGGTVTHDVSVIVSDGSSPISGQSTVRARKQGSDERVSETTRSGQLDLQLESGTWEVQATHGGHSSGTESVSLGELHSPGRLTLTVDLPEVSVTVVDPDRNAAIPNATVRLDGAGQTLTAETDSSGSVSFDPPSGADTVTITAIHEWYHESVSEFSVDSGITETIELAAKKGDLRLATSIDGAPAGGMDVTIAPVDDYLKTILGDPVTVSSNPDGTHQSSVLVGRYRAQIDPPASTEGLYRGSETTFEVTEGDRTDITMDAEFTWELSPAHRDRIREIRRGLDQITDKSGIDLAIPNYYASVIESVLDAVEGFPEQGDQFVGVDAHPDEITDATLAAADAAVDAVGDAMSTKRNRDLFTACADMADATVRWRGSFDVPTLVERLDEDGMAVRRRYAARADSVADRIDAERGVVSEVAPARSMLEEVDIESRGDHVEEVVATHVAIMLLDAVDELFDHPELTERLSRTVF